MTLTLPYWSKTVWSDGNGPSDYEELVLGELRKTVALGDERATIQEQVTESLKKLNESNDPPMPCPSQYHDGDIPWVGRDGSKWRYSKNANKWRRVSGP